MFEPYYYMIVVGGIVTLLNRLAGHYVLRRFEPINPRMEAALEAVPVAVITAIVAPSFIDGSMLDRAALVLAMLLGLRFGFLLSGGLALGFLAGMRYLGF